MAKQMWFKSTAGDDALYGLFFFFFDGDSLEKFAASEADLFLCVL